MGSWFERSLLAGIIAVLAIACGETADEIDNAIDCNGICNRYSDCFDKDYDVDACVDDCKDAADSDSDFQSQVESCETCIDDKSCSAATFTCTADCAGVVP